MALTASNKALAEDFINLKARVKAEMNRRNLTNSLVSYAGADYDYSVVPTIGDKLLSEHIEKIIVPINAIASTGFSTEQEGLLIKAMDTLDVQLSAHETKPLRGSGTDCAAGCSGLCTNACTGTCQGSCSGSCTGSCSGSCSGGCSGCSGCTNCSGSCTGSCSGCSGCTNCSGCGPCTGCLGKCTGCGNACSSCGDLCSGGCGRLAG